MITVSAITERPCALGEGPLWDTEHQRLFWVDSVKGQIFCLSDDNLIKQWQLSAMVGSLAVIDKHQILVALQTGLHRFNLESETLDLIHDPESHLPQTRMNDGKTDRVGQFLFASMGIKDRTQGWGSLYRLNHAGDVEILLDDVVVGNGPCFSPSGDWFYFSDGRGTIQKYPYHPEKPLGPATVFFDARAKGLACDGATVDASGNIWTALIGSSKIGCIDKNGILKLTVEVPIPLPSSVMFGGPDLRQLFVTSISDSGNRQDNSPGAGLLYRVVGLKAQGLSETPFKGQFWL